MAAYLTNSARTLIFSTGPAPPSAAAGLAALDVMRSEPRRIERLLTNAATLRAALIDEGFGASGDETQIVPLIVGESRLASEFCERALARGVFAQAIRPPTVPEGTARLRLAAMATHTPTELRWAARQLATAARDAGLEPADSVVEPEPEPAGLPSATGQTAATRIYDAELEEPAYRRAA